MFANFERTLEQGLGLIELTLGRQQPCQIPDAGGDIQTVPALGVLLNTDRPSEQSNGLSGVSEAALEPGYRDQRLGD